MDLVRFEQFKQQSDMIIKTSVWLTQEIDSILEEEAFYTDNPYLDTYKLMEQRHAVMDELTNRSDVESRINANHRRKYKDLYDLDF